LFAAEKTYEQSPAVLLNILYDIVEMWKAKVKQDRLEELIVDTIMYGRKIEYIFSIINSGKNTSVTVKTEGERENAERRIQLVFAMLDNMIEPFIKRVKSSNNMD
jgi:hypothetical protein